MLSLSNAFTEEDLLNFEKKNLNFLSENHDFKISYSAEPKIDGTKLQIYMPDYWVYVNYGTSAGDVPYTPRKAGEPAKGGSSKYISALYNYLITKGFNSSDPRTKGIAFAIANKQKKYGNPIDRSKLGFLEKSIRDNQDKWISAIEEAMGQALEVAIFEEFDRANKQIKI